MAQFCPPLSVIENMKTQPTEGEWKLLPLGRNPKRRAPETSARLNVGP